MSAVNMTYSLSYLTFEENITIDEVFLELLHEKLHIVLKELRQILAVEVMENLNQKVQRDRELLESTLISSIFADQSVGNLWKGSLEPVSFTVSSILFTWKSCM